jgi:EmrB/QacA subfamily drug resistance transporter
VRNSDIRASSVLEHGSILAIGPVTGGWLLEHFWWGSVFLVNVPVVVVALVLGQLFVPTSRDPSAPPIDVAGALLSIAGLVALVWAIIEGPGGWTDPEILIGFGLAAVLLGVFVLWERRIRFPMLDVDFFRNPRFSAASAAIMLTFFAMFGSLFLLTQFLQSILGYTPLEAGIRLLPMAGVMVVISPLSARLVERIGSKVVVATGLSVAAIGLVVASRLTAGASYPEVATALVVLAAGLALVMPPATESIMGSLPLAKAGVGSAVNDTTRQVGGALGVAVLGSVMSSTYGPRVSEAISASAFPFSAEQSQAIHDQIGAAMQAAREIGGPPGRMLADVASRAFADGMSTAFIIGASALVLGAVIVTLFLPARARDHVVAVAGDAVAGDSSDGEVAGHRGNGQRLDTPAGPVGQEVHEVPPSRSKSGVTEPAPLLRRPGRVCRSVGWSPHYLRIRTLCGICGCVAKATNTPRPWPDRAGLDAVRGALDDAEGRDLIEALAFLREAADRLTEMLDESMAAAVLLGDASLRATGARAGLTENAVGPRLARTRALGAYADERGRVTAAGVERARYDLESGVPRRPPAARAPMRFKPRRRTK